MMGFGMGFGILGLLLMVLFWGSIILGAVWLLKAVFQTGKQTTASTRMGPGQNAREILDHRYAQGELTREQYELIRQDLEA
ncbi:MAG: hypothetical protein E4G99_08105 [Anaerolineales bacterium]|nr:MAG: hypothetical protein E4G99_08105 [Anaerolineales bacterium]